MIAKLRLYTQLCKPLLVFFISYSALAGYIAGEGEYTSSLLLFLIGFFLVAGGAAAINQIQEVKSDRLLTRTQNRPIVSGAIKKKNAIVFALVLIAGGTLLLNLISMKVAFLGLLNIIVYNLLYTTLKYKSIYSVLIGAITGCIPPYMGYVAAGGSLLDIKIVFFMCFMFLWQIPHFWLLILKHKHDYLSSGLQTVINKMDEKKILKLILLWILLSYFPAIMSIISSNGSIRIMDAVFCLIAFATMSGTIILIWRRKYKPAFISVNVYLLLTIIGWIY